MGYELIETIEVGSGGASSIEFTSIPQDGVDLVLKGSIRGDFANYVTNLAWTLNNNTSATYSFVSLRGIAGSINTQANSQTSNGYPIQPNGGTSTSNTFGSFSFYVSNYTSSTDKSISYDSVSENNSSDALQAIVANSVNITTGITSIELFPASDNLLQYSTASLYKITDA